MPGTAYWQSMHHLATPSAASGADPHLSDIGSRLQGEAAAQVEKIQEGLNRRPPRRREADSRAVVACLLRPACNAGESLEVFYILRSERPGQGSRWAGQVAFPGGHVDEDESDHEAVVRECFEEVGLELDSGSMGRFVFLGCVRERLVPRRSSTLAVACRVYLQLPMEREATPLHPEPSEVAACGWAPLSALLVEECAKPLQWSERIDSSKNGRMWDGAPSVPLPVRSLVVAPGVAAEGIEERFILWGLTLGIVNDLLLTAQLRSTPIDLKPLSGM